MVLYYGVPCLLFINSPFLHSAVTTLSPSPPPYSSAARSGHTQASAVKSCGRGERPKGFHPRRSFVDATTPSAPHSTHKSKLCFLTAEFSPSAEKCVLASRESDKYCGRRVIRTCAMHRSNSAISARCAPVANTREPKQFYGDLCESPEESHAAGAAAAAVPARGNGNMKLLRRTRGAAKPPMHTPAGTREGLRLVKMDANDLAAYKK